MWLQYGSAGELSGGARLNCEEAEGKAMNKNDDNGWLEISTLPAEFKDGRPVLLGNSVNGREATATWGVVFFYGPESRGWLFQGLPIGFEPTHYQAAPPPPKRTEP
jgi:hypothetical protein